MNKQKNLKLYLELQLKEIEEHRYYMGEFSKRAISDEELLNDWINSGHAQRFSRVYFKNEADILEFFIQNQEIGNFNTALTNDRVHKLLHD